MPESYVRLGASQAASAGLRLSRIAPSPIGAMDRLKRFGERLKEARRAKGLTQVGLAHALNSDPTHISRWERGKIQPSHESLEALANALERAPSWLLDYDDSSVDEPTAGRELTIDAIEQEWRDDGVFPEAIRLWRTRIAFRG